MKPQFIFFANSGNGPEVIDHTGAYIPGSSNNHDRFAAIFQVGFYRLFQYVILHFIMGVC